METFFLDVYIRATLWEFNAFYDIWGYGRVWGGRDKSLQLILEFSNGRWATLPITFEYLHYFM